ncbi:NAD(P)/FAD-dependent oxidoreductase [Novosphingobium cyanobacteriorum]|uniref:NAD(P)-binding protein n=1 Tax=Novosphingobium cyanobacteriorum TaxID=3024215 RepID=A0ABT6CMF4_9SPHN|nr:NAD(P)/FAD-dependent oxidoreductase [Novosphingobium cyanobacteriorum]MDF8335099.1 NAD(P)-binding protein [Novosphingobium cyanobacteriorum]
MAEPTRRDALKAGAVGAGALALGSCAKPAMAGTLDGADWRRGHMIRDGKFPAPNGAEPRVGILIAGGGVAGLAAAWRMKAAGFDDFVVLELEDRVGGNARSGRNPVSAYPLGAHYLPVPNKEAVALRRMLQEFGMIVGEEGGAPIFDPYQLCADLEERLLWRGGWQEGLYPASGLSREDEIQRDRFTQAMAQLRNAVGADGRPAFAIPRVYSSADPAYTALDKVSFAAWLDDHGYSSPVLRAYLRYCCRDDYGTEPDDVSAWAGLHYFAARRGWAARGDGDRELTWPEGNGRLVSLLLEQTADHVRPAHSVFAIAQQGDEAVVDSFDHKAGSSTRWHASCVIVAMPHFVAARVAPAHTGKGRFRYAPWVVANVTVNRHPKGRGVGLAWDNVSTGSDSLGYVVATHQSASGGDGPTVLTWYLPLSKASPPEARKLMMTRTLAAWQRIIEDDLLTMNPDLAGAIDRIDVWRWGHAMISPTPGFLTDPVRTAAIEARPPVLFAHSDLSGLSLFEEAHYRGVVAAETALAHLGHSFESLI